MQELTTRQKEICAVALQLFSEKGYKETSVRDIAKVLDIKAASLYAHIKSKEQVLNLIFQSYHDILTSYLNRYLELEKSIDNWQEKFDLMTSMTIKVIHENVETSEIFKRYFFNFAEPGLKEKHVQMVGIFLKELAEIIENLHRENKSEKFIDPEITAQFFFFNLTSSYRWTPKKMPLEEIIKIFQTRILSGFIGNIKREE